MKKLSIAASLALATIALSAFAASPASAEDGRYHNCERSPLGSRVFECDEGTIQAVTMPNGQIAYTPVEFIENPRDVPRRQAYERYRERRDAYQPPFGGYYGSGYRYGYYPQNYYWDGERCHRPMIAAFDTQGCEEARKAFEYER